MYRNSLFYKPIDIAINLITAEATVVHGGPFGRSKTQIFEMNRVNSAASLTTVQRF